MLYNGISLNDDDDDDDDDDDGVDSDDDDDDNDNNARESRADVSCSLSLVWFVKWRYVHKLESAPNTFYSSSKSGTMAPAVARQRSLLTMNRYIRHSVIDRFLNFTFYFYFLIKRSNKVLIIS